MSVSTIDGMLTEHFLEFFFHESIFVHTLKLQYFNFVRMQILLIENDFQQTVLYKNII